MSYPYTGTGELDPDEPPEKRDHTWCNVDVRISAITMITQHALQDMRQLLDHGYGREELEALVEQALEET